MYLLTEYQYFPVISLYRALNKNTNIIFEQYEHYQKMSFRNRCIISGANGPIQLSVPLAFGREQKTLTREVKILASSDWQKSHWKTIVSCYNRSPWFEFYRNELEALYKKQFIFLVDWDMACFEWTISKLALPVNISVTDNYTDYYDPVQYLDFRNKLFPKNYMDFNPPEYHQVFRDRHGFTPNLSILDLLFCEGKQSSSFLESLKDF
jgi:hypothetical protein